MENKYYYMDYQGYSKRQTIMLWNERYTIELDEDIDWKQYIDLCINKNPKEKLERPKSSEYEKVKPILKELFEDYYTQALKYISKAINDEGEFYIIKNSKAWFLVEYYSLDEKHSEHICIDFRDNIEYLMLMLSHRSGHKGRPNARKKGRLITNKDFRLFINLALKYFSDSNSLAVYLDSFLKNFYALSKGENSIEGFDVTAEKAFQNILEQLIQRKITIEKQLIEQDDSNDNRIKLRGELEGINYAIKTIDMYK